MRGEFIARRPATAGKTLRAYPGGPATLNPCCTPQGPWVLFLRDILFPGQWSAPRRVTAPGSGTKR